MIALFSLVVDLNDTLLTILSNTLTQFGLHMTSYNNSSFITMSSSNESIDDSNFNGSNLLLTSMFDVETAISDLTHVLLYEMKEWVVKIRMVCHFLFTKHLICFGRSGRKRRRMICILNVKIFLGIQCNYKRENLCHIYLRMWHQR